MDIFTLRTTSVAPESMNCGTGHRNAPCKAQEMEGKIVVVAKTARVIFIKRKQRTREREKRSKPGKWNVAFYYATAFSCNQ